MFDVKGKRVAITGAGRGIGRAIFDAFLAAGAHPVGLVRSQSTEHELSATGGDVVLCDISERASVRVAIDEVFARFGKLDVLINNAGIATEKPAASLDDDSVDQLIKTNLLGVFYASTSYYRKARKSGGIIINVASILGSFGSPLTSVYSATKGGVLQLTRSLAAEWAGSGWRVNAIAPGFIDTDMTDVIKNRSVAYNALVASIPLKRMGTPADIAPAALFLASDAASYMQGTVITIDGGLTMRV